MRIYDVRPNRSTGKSSLPPHITVVVQANSESEAKRIAENQNAGYRAVGARAR